MKVTYRTDDGGEYVHDEPPSRPMPRPEVHTIAGGIIGSVTEWDNGLYYGLVRRFAWGSPLGGGPYAILSITATDETARHDWRDFQAIKNLLLGDEWEAVELYPAESRLVDPSNRFFLWAFPKGVIPWGLPEQRHVRGAREADAPQRPFPNEADRDA